MKLNIKNRDLVIPGEFLAEGECLLGEGTFRKGDKVYSSLMGLVDAKENFVKNKYSDCPPGVKTAISLEAILEFSTTQDGNVQINNRNKSKTHSNLLMLIAPVKILISLSELFKLNIVISQISVI